MDEKTTCILIDDDEDDHSFFGAALKKHKEEIHCTHYFDPREALDKLLCNNGPKPSWIFVDLNMPKLSGLEFLKILKKVPDLSDVPVIIYSTSSCPKDIDECKKFGAAGYMVKPNNMEDLVTRLSEYFG